MWNQNSGKPISVLGESEPKGDSIVQHPPNDKQLFESSGQDSGFLSGPQNTFLSDDDIIVDASELPLSSVGGGGNQHSKNNNVTSYTDSGAIDDDFDDVDKNDNKITKDSSKTSDATMILDSGVDLGLEEWFCGLNLKNTSQPLNNLGNCRKNMLEEDKFPRITKQLQHTPLWEICYIQDDDGDTQLHLAILGKYEEAIWTIIRLAPHPACLDIRNDDAQAPLHLAVLTRQWHVVRRLLVAGAKASIRDRDGNTPLHLACLNSDIKCVEALTAPFSAGEIQEYNTYDIRVPQLLAPDLEQKNHDGEYCVHIAAMRNNIDILRHLVSRGANINAREGKCGYTVLHYACENRNEKLVKFLLNDCNQLDIETCTYGLLTAYQLAAEQNDRYLMEELGNCGAELLTPPQSDDDYSDSYDEDDEF